MKIVTVVGARPQFVKAGAVSRVLRQKHNEILVHTGQHYDENMSQVFFDQLKIPKPEYNLCVGSGNHGKQTGRMLEKIEEVILEEKPDMMIVYGDTNSTIAGALAASKLHIPVAHVEAGLRSFNMAMPEEQNRVLTDHISKILLCPTNTAVENLKKEGIQDGVFNVGDVMLDTVLHNVKIAQEKSDIINRLDINNQDYILSTIHRAENTDDISKLENILKALISFEFKIVFPIHPRTRNIINTNEQRFSFIKNSNIMLIEPVSYLDMLVLEKNAKCIMTDSGGVQKEAYFFEIPCITLREETEWVETLYDDWNVLVGSNQEKILEAVDKVFSKDYRTIPQKKYFGEGNASEKVLQIIERGYL
ncbi:MAG: UDP-N-acetylglucosamine 2-epimerase (non-hydrolyzing) [Epulopiscium sp.]|nr:UDP-N-acetylglucosamine 2-epimerase (non-hydrolyzing) [Candidatus Epulonipiscium sp.]